MALVVWNQYLNEGVGRSGSRYAIARHGAAGEAPWLVVVDGDELCVAGNATDALIQAENLEALRCFLRGLGAEMTVAELHRAGLVAAQMSHAARRAGADPHFSSEQRRQAERTWQRLRALRGEIESAARQRIAWQPQPSELVH